MKGNTQVGADIVIGVDVQDGLLDHERNKNTVQITGLQSIERMKKCF
jgi:NTE family protein